MPESCSYCGEEFGGSVATHERTCFANEDFYRSLRKALDRGDGAIRKVQEYRMQGNRPLSDNSLRRRLGSWENIAAFFNLAYITESQEDETPDFVPTGVRYSFDGLKAKFKGQDVDGRYVYELI